ncbi:MAG: hypothetical protein ACLFVU_03335 [Phycisphaerae bacterium]
MDLFSEQRLMRAIAGLCSDVSAAGPAAELPDCPRDRRELRAAVKELFDIDVPERSVCGHHDSPMDYLEAAFFHQPDMVVWANRGGGKTMMAAIATLMDGLYHAPVQIRVLGGSFEQSDKLGAYIKDFLRQRDELAAEDPTRDRVRLIGCSEIRMLTQSQRAVRGLHVQKIRCDEVDLFDPGVWQAVQFATRSSESMRGSIEVLSTLHRSGGLMDNLVRRARAGKSGYRLFRWCLWDVIERCTDRECAECPLQPDCNGLARRADGFFSIDDAIAIRGRSSRAAWETEMLCRGAKRDWLVFREFDQSRHVREVSYVPDWPLYRAIDFGYRSPLVCLWVQLTPVGSVHVIGEYIQSHRPISHHAREMLRQDPGPVRATYVDPAGRQREATSGVACTDLLAAAGIPCTWRQSQINAGLELIRESLAPADGQPRLVISPRCEGLIDAFGSYHYPAERRDGSTTENPAKDGPDHAIDALRYFFVNRLGGGAKTGTRTY